MIRTEAFFFFLTRQDTSELILIYNNSLANILLKKYIIKKIPTVTNPQ